MLDCKLDDINLEIEINTLIEGDLDLIQPNQELMYHRDCRNQMLIPTNDTNVMLWNLMMIGEVEIIMCCGGTRSQNQ